MIHQPDRSVPFLAKNLKPHPTLDRIHALIADLDADDFATRENASQALRNLGHSARPALEEAAKSNSLEQARRAHVQQQVALAVVGAVSGCRAADASIQKTEDKAKDTPASTAAADPGIGVAPRHIVEGRSLAPFLRGEKPAGWRSHVFSEYDYSMQDVRRALGLPVDKWSPPVWYHGSGGSLLAAPFPAETPVNSYLRLLSQLARERVWMLDPFFLK